MRRLLVLLLLVPILGWAQSSFDGTWKLDLNTFQFGEKPDVFLLENGMYVCKSCAFSQEIKADGQPQKLTGNPYADTLTIKVIDDRHLQRSSSKNGKPVMIADVAISEDGKTLTTEWTGYSPTTGKKFTGKTVATRVGDAPPGAHLVSGSWKPVKVSDVTEEGLIFTYKTTPNGITMTQASGESYTAKFDGKDVPYNGDPGITTIALEKLGPNVIQETLKRDGEVIVINKITSDGKVLTIESHDKLRGTTSRGVANKQAELAAE